MGERSNSGIVDFIAARGIHGIKDDQKEFVRKVNVTATLAGLLGLVVGVSSALFEFNGSEALKYIYLLGAIVYLLIPFYHHLGWYKISVSHFAIVIPAWFAVQMVYHGGHFGQTFAFGVTMLFFWFVYRRRSDWLFKGVLVYNILLYVSVSAYLGFRGPLNPIDYPFDEILIFIFGIALLRFVVMAYEATNTQIINELQYVNAEMAAKTERLEMFSHMLAHDLRTPLVTLVSHSELMRSSLKSENYNRANDSLRFISDASSGLMDLVDGISTLNDITQRQEQCVITALDTNQSLQKTRELLSCEIDAKNGRLIVEALPNYPILESDFSILCQNLILNGFKYNKSSEPQVTVSSEITDNGFRFIFDDNGIGIDAEHHEQVFNFFERLYPNSAYAGSGLGLGICRQICRMYNGSVYVNSELNKGSRFIVELPAIPYELKLK